MNLERKRPDGVQGLPSGWKREEVVRRRGLSAGKIDVIYCRCANEQNGDRFVSVVLNSDEVVRYKYIRRPVLICTCPYAAIPTGWFKMRKC